MGNIDNDKLDKRRKRLERLANSWETQESLPLFGEGFAPADLRLLLERYEPLRDLIRALVAAPGNVSPVAPQTQRPEKEELVRLQSELAQTKSQFGDLQQHLAQCQADTRSCRQQNLDLTREHESCRQQNLKLTQEREQLDKQLQKAIRDLKSCRAERDHSLATSTELEILRKDTELAQRLELADLPADQTQALIRVVAVLAQRDNLERLWNALKERCERQDRPASEAELSLLRGALGWHNHNWRAHPLRLIEAPASGAYNFEQHLRSQHTSAGETISESRLPGILDGSGKTLCKPLVTTRK
jgi:hypothetical protein